MLIFGVIVGLVVGEVAACVLCAFIELQSEKKHRRRVIGSSKTDTELIKS